MPCQPGLCLTLEGAFCRAPDAVPLPAPSAVLWVGLGCTVVCICRPVRGGQWYMAAFARSNLPQGEGYWGVPGLAVTCRGPNLPTLGKRGNKVDARR